MAKEPFSNKAMLEPLHIEENKFGLKVYCPVCEREYTIKNIGNCNHPERQYYKSIVYTKGNSRKTLSHESKDWEEALIEAIKFKRDVKASKPNLSQNLKKSEDPNSISIIDGANMFLNFKHDINVQIHQRRNLSRNYLSSIQLYVGQFIDAMREAGFEVERMPISNINEVHVGIWYMKMTSHYAKGSWNGPIRALRAWIDFMKDRKKVDMFNPFKDAKLVQTENAVEVITKEEFEAVCDAVQNLSPWAYLGGKTTKRKNRYRPYLIDAFKLALYTGLRREEFLTLTWSDIHLVNDELGYMIITDNIKVERITGMKYKKKYVPVGEELHQLLLELGWDELGDTDNFIIEPLRRASTETLMGNCSKAFSHYYKQAFPGRRVKQLKVLRKTYLTQLARQVGDDVIVFSSHSGTKVLEDHYFDKKLLAKGVGLKIFV